MRLLNTNSNNARLYSLNPLPTVSLSASSQKKATSSNVTTLPLARIEQQASALLDAYRAHGHRLAHVDPLELATAANVPELELAYHGLSTASLDAPLKGELLPGFAGAPFSQFLEALRQVYCGSVGIEAAHLRNASERSWLHAEFE